MRVNLQQLVMDYSSAQPDHIQEAALSDCALSITQLRDQLYLLGIILYEDLEHQVYVAAVRAGVGDMSSAVVALQLCDRELLIAGYAKEGLIKQHICAQAIQKVLHAAGGKKAVDSSGRPKWITAILVLIGLAVFLTIRWCILSGADRAAIELSPSPPAPEVEQAGEAEPAEDPAFVAEVERTVDATRAYNEAAREFNLLVSAYNEAVSLICIDNIYEMPAELEPIALEDESYEANAGAVHGGNSREKIAADTETIGDMAVQAASLLQVAQQLHAPTGDWVAACLEQVEGITACQQVTAEHDPDGLLGEDGGYSACVYFSHTAIDQSGVPGEDLAAKGTDAGGAVEVYPTLDGAQARAAYLAGFDDTILYSGSYAVVGTMVIRTSYQLSDEQQLLLTDAIIKAMTAVSGPAESHRQSRPSREEDAKRAAGSNPGGPSVVLIRAHSKRGLEIVPSVGDFHRLPVVVAYFRPGPHSFAIRAERYIHVLKRQRNIVRRIVYAPVLLISNSVPQRKRIHGMFSVPDVNFPCGRNGLPAVCQLGKGGIISLHKSHRPVLRGKRPEQRRNGGQYQQGEEQLLFHMESTAPYDR